MTIDFDRGSKVAGSKFYFLTGPDAWREWKLINEMLIYHHEVGGYEFVIPPYFVNRDCATWAGNLPRFEDQIYSVDNGRFYAIPTAESALVGMHADELFRNPNKELPIRYCAVSPCFRREAGASGMKTSGLKRVHQFHKVELFEIRRQEDSEEAHDAMVKYVCRMIENLYPRLNYRTVELTPEDRSPFSNKTIDIEIKVGDEWLEVSSISNMGENQSKLAQIRYKNEKGKNVKCHLLNGSALALPRLTLALQELENKGVDQ